MWEEPKREALLEETWSLLHLCIIKLRSTNGAERMLSMKGWISRTQESSYVRDMFRVGWWGYHWQQIIKMYTARAAESESQVHKLEEVEDVPVL